VESLERWIYGRIEGQGDEKIDRVLFLGTESRKQSSPSNAEDESLGSNTTEGIATSNDLTDSDDFDWNPIGNIIDDIA
jgi:hypothetical protein